MKISIVLVVYKTLEWIDECINSIFEQSYRDFELIIISNDDDKLMDRKIHELTDGKNHVRYVRNLRNTGGAAACDKGIRLARGEYVFLMDSDDVLPRDALYYLAKTADATGSDVIIGRGKILREGRTANVDYVPDWISWEKPMTVRSISEAPFLSFNPYYWGKLYKRSMLSEKNIHMARNAMNADRNFNCRALIAASSISVCAQNTYLWRKRPKVGTRSSVTQARAKKRNFLDRVKMMKKTDEEFLRTGDENLYQYSRISGLMRNLILAVDCINNPEFRKLFLQTMSSYLEDFSYEEISSCEFMSYRVKTLAYLIKAQRYDDFDKFINYTNEISKVKKKGKVIYSYPNIDVLEEFRTQYNFHLTRVTMESMETCDDGIVINGSSKSSKIRKPEPVGICIMDDDDQEVCRIDIENWKVEEKRLKFSAKIDEYEMGKLKKGENYYCVLYYIIHQRAAHTEMTDKEKKRYYFQI